MAIIFTTNGVKETEMERVPYTPVQFIPHGMTICEKVIWNERPFIIGRIENEYYVFEVLLNFKGEETAICVFNTGFRISAIDNWKYVVIVDYVQTHRTFTAERFMKKYEWRIREFANEIIAKGFY